MSSGDRRFPARVYEAGTEPDARFSLANERTYLAWIRTSLALLAAGVALTAVDLPIARPFEMGASLIFMALGALAPVQAWLGWARTERALRERRPLPGSLLAAPIGVGTFVAAALLVVGLLV